MTLKLTDLEAPLDDVEFPNGAVRPATPFGATEYKLWRALATEQDAGQRGAMLMQIIRACYPTASDDDIDSCTPKMLIAMAAHAGRKIDQIRDALKNVDVAAAVASQPSAAPVSPPSSPTTSGNTSSPKSRKRSGKTGGMSTTAPSPT